MEDVEIPQSIRLAIQARVNTLPPAARDTLRLAAIYGRDFDYPALRAMSELDEDRLIEALETAERAQLIEEVSAGAGAGGPVSFTFAHALIPSALQESLSGLRRQRLHRRAAESLERLYPDRATQQQLAPQLAHHYAEAGEWDRAASYWLEAGERARDVYAYPEAIRYLKQALALLKERAADDLDRAARISMQLGTLYHTTFDYQRSRQAFQDAFTLWQRAGEARPETVLPPASHAFRQYWPAGIDTLDLTLSNDATTIPLIEQLFSGLVELTPDLDVTPALARTWEVSDDGREYVFRLRDDARWSDGRPVTAGDVEYAWKRALHPETHSLLAEVLLDLAGARALPGACRPGDIRPGDTIDGGALGVCALDDYTLAVDLVEPVGHFLHLLGMPVTFPLPRHAVEAYGAAWCAPEHIVTNGPFRLEAWEPGQRFVLVRDPDYRGRRGGNVERVELELIGDEHPEKRLALYEAGLQDIVHPQGLGMLGLARAQHAQEYHAGPSAHTLYLGLDASHPPFDDLRVRQAMAHALDRKTLANAVWRGTATPALGGLVPPGMPGHSPGIALAYDPDRARRLLAEAGYPRGEGFPAVEACAHWSPVYEPTGQYIVNQWRDILGLQITWTRLDWLAYKERLRENMPEIYVMGWVVDYPDPDCFLRVAMHQPYVLWRNDSYEQLLESARRIADEAERVKFYRAADRLLIEEAAIIPLFHGQHHFLIKPWVERFPTSPIRTSYWKDVILSPH